MTLSNAPTSRIFTALLAALVLALAPAAASGHARPCTHHSGYITGNEIGTLWHSGHSLVGCTTEYDEAHIVRRLGPWTLGTKVKFDGANVVWTVRQGATDRVWAANVHNGQRWLTGTRLAPQGAGLPFADGRVYRLLQVGEQAGWITTGGEVVAATDESSFDATPVGTPPAPFVTSKQLLLIGRFASIAPATLAAHTHFTTGQGETDDCGGTIPYTLTVRPNPSAPAFGATWFAEFRDIPTEECS